MFDKIKKLIQQDLHKRYEQLEERFLVFEQRLYGHLADRLDSLENQLDQLSEILRQKAAKSEAENSQDDDDHSEETPAKEEKKAPKSNSEKSENKADDLQDLPGLGNSLEKKLHAEGIMTFRQLAGLSDKELDALNEKIPGLKIRYIRYEWKKEAEERTDK